MLVDDSALPFLQAVETVLKSSLGLTAIVGLRIHGAPPVKPTYPYVVITCASQPYAADDFTGMEHRLRVQGYARENRPGTALAIRQQAFAALNRQETALALPANDLILIEHEGIAECFPEEDGRTYQSVIEFKALVI